MARMRAPAVRSAAIAAAVPAPAIVYLAGSLHQKSPGGSESARLTSRYWPGKALCPPVQNGVEGDRPARC